MVALWICVSYCGSKAMAEARSEKLVGNAENRREALNYMDYSKNTLTETWTKSNYQRSTLPISSVYRQKTTNTLFLQVRMSVSNV